MARTRVVSLTRCISSPYISPWPALHDAAAAIQDRTTVHLWYTMRSGKLQAYQGGILTSSQQRLPASSIHMDDRCPGEGAAEGAAGCKGDGLHLATRHTAQHAANQNCKNCCLQCRYDRTSEGHPRAASLPRQDISHVALMLPIRVESIARAQDAHPDGSSCLRSCSRCSFNGADDHTTHAWGACGVWDGIRNVSCSASGGGSAGSSPRACTSHSTFLEDLRHNNIQVIVTNLQWRWSGLAVDRCPSVQGHPKYIDKFAGNTNRCCKQVRLQPSA